MAQTLSMREAVEEALEVLQMLYINGDIKIKDKDNLVEVIHTFNCYLDEGC
tara:strand:- start:544 stop:696 length:153 start_codon:yes stop_codon:yes gene_type:complete